MSGITPLSLGLWGLCLLCAAGGTARSGAVVLRGRLDRGSLSLNDMFREVEELMEDTQHILDEAVDQITTESEKFSSASLDLRPSYHNETMKMINSGDGATRVLDRTDKETNNMTGDTHLSHIHMEVSGQWNNANHRMSREKKGKREEELDISQEMTDDSLPESSLEMGSEYKPSSSLSSEDEKVKSKLKVKETGDEPENLNEEDEAKVALSAKEGPVQECQTGQSNTEDFNEECYEHAEDSDEVDCQTQRPEPSKQPKTKKKGASKDKSDDPDEEPVCLTQQPQPSDEPKTKKKECMVDEDCGDLRYCLYEIENSKCLPCIPTDMPCSKDEECCSDQMCVWGQCTLNATGGAEGTICQGQSDCRPDLCCAFQREFLFPVCNPKPAKGDSCQNHPNLLMDMLAWDQEGPRDHCPCADNLQCQPHGRGSVCAE